MLSYFFQSLLYSPIFAENPVKKTHLVAVFVDKNIYKWLETDIKWYASQYIQSHISDSKAIVLPIDTKNFAAKDIAAMLENMYFDGVKDSSSDLLGAIFLGNIPLPVVEQNGFIYPSIYPYVDFEHQQFVYNANQDYFVYNNVPNGQPEIWHGLINFGTDISAYTQYFQKLRTYVKSPSTYVAPRLWYDDFVWMKSTFLKDSLPAYLNNFVFTEDVGYHRYTNLMLDYMKTAVNDSMSGVVNGFLDSAGSSDLSSSLSSGFNDVWNSQIPTVMLSSVIKELIKTYDSLYPGVFMSQMRDNTQAASRWYKKASDGSIVDAVDSHIGKVELKDSWVLWDVWSGVSPLLVNYNTKLEAKLDEEIVNKQWSLKVPVLDTWSYARYEKKSKLAGIKKYCSTEQEDSYQNYYFGKKVSDIKDPQDLSIYKWTYRNSTGLQYEPVYLDAARAKSWFTQSLGASYGVFDTQIEANRGYNIFSAARESDVYNDNKKPLYISASCSNWSKFLWWKLYCKSYSFKVDDASKIESPSQFAQRNWWGASSLNLDTWLLALDIPQYKLNQYDYRNSQSPIYDLGWATALSSSQNAGNSVAALSSYASIIKIKTREWDLNYPLYIKGLDLPGYVSDPSGYKKFQWDKIRSTYAWFDYFDQYYATSNRGNGISKTISLPNNKSDSRKQWELGGKCSGKYSQEYNYAYTILKSIVKNVSPSAAQINGDYSSPFTGDGLWLKHYTFFSDGLSSMYTTFSAVKDSDSNLNTLNSLVTSIYNATKVLSWTNNADTWSLLAASTAILATSGALFATQLDQLDDVTSMFYQIPDADWAKWLIQNLSDYFVYMKQTEALDSKKTQFLQSWITALDTQKTLIKNTVGALSTKYKTLQTNYQKLVSANYGIGVLQTKRSQLTALHNCGTGPSSYTWVYADVCESIDSTISTLSGFVAEVNRFSATTATDDDGKQVSTQNPFNDSDLVTLFGDTSWTPSLDTLLSDLKSRVTVIATEPAPTLVEWLNQTTRDRPIDSDRNVTFKGLGWDIVKFTYPNLYDVSVYDNQNWSLILKTPEQIQNAIISYLTGKVVEYNKILKVQEGKRVSYYNGYKEAFTLLGQADALASPGGSRTTQYLPDLYFVNILKDQIPQIAELLYYQSLPSYLRTAQSNISKDLNGIRNSFDINRKIWYVMSGYLTKHADFGSIISPSYLWSGYEVAYINSDGSDYIPQQSVPEFISSLQKSQLNYTAPSANQLILQEPAYTKAINDCKLDSNYSADLFTLKPKPGSPWIDALKCRWKQIPTSTRFNVTFAIGPSPAQFLASLSGMFETWKSSFNQILQQPTPVFSGNLADYWSDVTQPVATIDASSVSSIDFVLSSASVVAGTQIPFTLLAKDKNWTILTSTASPYRLVVNDGDWVFVDGQSKSNESVPFSDFGDILVYQAPRVTSTRNVTLSLLQGDKVVKEQLLTIEPADFTVTSNSTKLYANGSNLRDLQFTLKDATTIPKLSFSLKTKSGRLLDTAITIASQRGLVTPGTSTASGFKASSSFLIEKWVLNISLMPNFVAGDDTLIIEIPGLDPISIPLHIVAWTASKVSLTVNSPLLDMWSNLTWSIIVTDAWGNIVPDTRVKFGSDGPINISTKTITVSDTPYTFSATTQEPGGVAYVFAYIDWVSLSDQSPAYQQVTVQRPFLPEKNLNIMYLNLFGSDWWNQRWYWSRHSNYVPQLIINSPKLLAVTTQLIDPSALKKFTLVVGQNGQVHPLIDMTPALVSSGDNLFADIPDIATVRLSSFQDIRFDSVEWFKKFDASSISEPTFMLLQDSSDSSLVVGKHQISSGEQMLINSDTQRRNTWVTITMEPDMYQGYSLWDLKLDGTKIGTLLYVLPTDTSVDDFSVQFSVPQEYATQTTFAQSSTNGLSGLWIYTSESIFEKEWYKSIEDSSDYKLGIGFLGDFKNITLFGDGKSVGEATVPYGSSFLINYGDPLLKRISDNIELKELPLDSGIGTQVYSEPDKTIFKVISADINNDALKDMVIVFTDGTVKVLKNYGGTNPYRDVGELFRLVDGIKDIQVGDVDNNGYADLIVRTDKDQLRVYTNDRWVFDVDGKLVCLNTNAQDGQMSTDPSHITDMQTFFEDMDKDGVLDIVTNDSIGDIKVFYGWLTNGEPNYLSTLAYTCDANWYTRQKNTSIVVKRFGLSVDPSLYIQDTSLLHIKWWNITSDVDTSTEDTDYSSATLPSNSPDFLTSLSTTSKNPSSFSVSSLMGWMSSYLQTEATKSLVNSLVVSPISEFTPSYEASWTHDTVWYKNLIALSGDANISVYKQYQDVNGGILVNWDEVKVTLTFLWLSNTIKASYIDRLAGPWLVPTDENDHITSWKVEQWTYDVNNVSWWYDDDIQFAMDNISLSKGSRLVVSYVVRYQGKPSVTVNVKSIQAPNSKVAADKYPDIITSPQDSCKKYRWDFINSSSSSHRSYDEILDTTIQDAVTSYLSQGSTSWSDMLSNSIPTPKTASASSWSEGVQSSVMNFVSSVMWGKSLFETWSVSDLFSNSSTNISLNLDVIDKAVAPVMDKVDKAMNALCQWFKLWKWGCQPPVPFNMIPFNQAFLAPGEYHLFGCTPKAPNPLAPVFAYINKMLGGWMPILFFPGTLVTPIGPIPMVGSSFIPLVFKTAADGFGLPGLPPPGGVYPSQVRLYVAPTLTLQMGVAICFGPYTVGANIPKLFRDLWGNCVVTAFPLYQSSCQASSSTPSDTPSTEVLDSWMTDLASQGSCQNPVQVGKTTVASSNNLIMTNTVTSPVYMTSRWAQSTSWTKAITNGNFGGMWAISFNDKPTKVSSTAYAAAAGNTVSTPSLLTSSDKTTDMLLAGVSFEPGKSINLKVLWANAKWIIEKLAKDWLGRQTKYIMNNLTKMTISITLPNVADLAKWFDQISLDNKETTKDTQFVTTRSVSNSSLVNKIAWLASTQNAAAASDFVNNPFDNLVTMFQQVPLIRLQSKDIIVNVPMVTTEDILKYTNYLKGRLNSQQKILKQWVQAVSEIMYVCGKVSPQQELLDLWQERILLNNSTSLWLTSKQQADLTKAFTTYEDFLKKQPATSPNPNLWQSVTDTLNQAKTQFALLGHKLVVLPILQASKIALTSKKTVSGSLTQQDQALYNRITSSIQNLWACNGFSANIGQFMDFYSNATKLVTNVKQNIQVLEQYKKFPSQLSKWMNAADSYLSDITSFLANTVTVLMQWMSTNAKIYAKYIDALILIVSSIKTWQILIDFSVNWSQKCGKCSRDSYGSYSCGLSFLLDKIKLPILPIPPFKIPNIYVDLSHVDLWMTVQLPKFRFVPVSIALPTIPNLPSPPNIDVSTKLDLNFSLNMFGNLNIPNIPILPSPPTLPELPSFIPKVDFALPTLPPAPKIPNLIPNISATLNSVSFLAKIFCIVKQGIGLVWEKGIKAKVEQLTQRTWDVKAFDFFDQTVSWKKDPPLYGFDFKLDGYLNFKMNFDPFYNLLNWIVAEVNNFSTKTQNGIQTYLSKQSQVAQKAVTDFSDKNINDINFNLNIKTDVNINTNILGSTLPTSGLDYDVASTKIKKDLAYFAAKVDDPQIQQKIKTVRSVVNQTIKVTPETKQLVAVQNQIQNVISAKQKEIKQLASRMDNYNKFLAQVDRQDAVLVSNDTVDTTYTVNLFSTDDATRKLLASQENPYKLALDTNAWLVERYVNTLNSSTAEDFGVDKLTYKKTTDYMTSLSSKINDVYDRLDLAPIAYDSCGMPRVVETPKVTSSNYKTTSSVWWPLLADNTISSKWPLLAANTTASTSTTTSTALSTDASYDLSSYVRGVFVPKTTASGTQMINVVKSDSYIEKIGDNYKVFSGNVTQDLNQDSLVDVLSWDTHGVYIKYSHQQSLPKAQASLQSYDKNYYVYDWWSRYIPSYHALLWAAYPDGDGYVSFGNGLQVSLVHPYPEVKNFTVSSQDFDSVQFSWTAHTSLWYTPDAYLVKLNQRIDTFTDKDKLFDLGLPQSLLSKSYVLFLPKGTDYTGALLNVGEKAYAANGKSFQQEELVTDLLSGGKYSGALLAVKYYDPEDETITSALSEIPRHWQYATIVGLQNVGDIDAQQYIIASPWSNQIVVWRQLLADSVWPSSTISLYRPAIKQFISTGSDHKWFVWTTYTLQANRKDNVAVAKMWIQQGDQIIALQTGSQETWLITLSGLYFTGNTSLSFIFGAEDFQGNRQTDPVRLTIETPTIAIKDAILTWSSGQIVAQLSHDVDEGLVTFQRQRNQRRQELTWTLSNTLWWFSLQPLQTILTWGVFSLGQDIGFYDSSNRQIGSLTPDWNLKIFSAYASNYKVELDLSSSLPALRVKDIKASDTLFWIHLPPKQLTSIILWQQEPLYTKVPLEWSQFGGFDGGVCIQDSTKQCLVYISKVWELYVPQQFVWSLRGSYFYDTINKTVVYTLRDTLSSDKDPYIVQTTLQVNVLH